MVLAVGECESKSLHEFADDHCLRFPKVDAETGNVHGGAQGGGHGHSIENRDVRLLDDYLAHSKPASTRTPDPGRMRHAEFVVQRWSRKNTPDPRRRVLLGDQAFGKAGLPERLIAEQHTAAWVWGVLARPPLHHEFCVPHAARVRSPSGGWLRVREVVIQQSDITVLDGMPVTAPLRTAVDIARFSVHFGKAEAMIISELMQRFGFTLADCQHHMNSRRNLPGKLLACARLQISSDGATLSPS